ncbi:PAS domain-containing protein [Oscillospiraceae bacterium HV4-5-C5C]|nr:PAS domain-containing protein [Oscillospiraceae bacterium HV4-5-C5C]
MKRSLLITGSDPSGFIQALPQIAEEYNLITADCMDAAVSALQAQVNKVSLAIISLQQVDSWGMLTLRFIRQRVYLQDLPVLISSVNEQTCNAAILAGANACLPPSARSEVWLSLIRNSLKLSNLATLAAATELDKLTGLYNRDAFFAAADKLIHAHQPGYYLLISVNIEHFKVINDQYGTAKGDEVLISIARSFRDCFNEIGGICCRYGGDHFAGLYPYKFKESAELNSCLQRISRPDCLNQRLKFRIGRVQVTSPFLPVSALYDRAVLAENSIKGRYDTDIADYQEAMREQLLQEQQMVSNMKEALAKQQFEIWLQPQYNHASGALIGAEALVRWRKSDGSLIPPNQFIPVFERNGFIYELDRYVWRSVCSLLRRWLDAGYRPLPIAVNVSRHDILMSSFLESLTALISEYQLPVELLRLEITESAFSKSPEQIVTVIKQLKDLGFYVEIDDFGSGYSSLNTLKDVPADMIKLDMKFLETSADSKRGGNILESVVRMAKWLDMAVIAEGVETLEQADFLKSIGCIYHQGYYYAQPMPVSDYLALFQSRPHEAEVEGLRTVQNLSTNSFWDPTSIDTLIFNSFIGGACILEVNQLHIEVLRANHKYVRVVNQAGMSIEEAMKLNWLDYMAQRSRQLFLQRLDRSSQNGEEYTDEYIFSYLPGCSNEVYLRLALRVIAASGERRLVYCMVEDVTELRKAETKARDMESRREALAEQLQIIMDSIQSAVSTAVIVENAPKIVFANEQFYQIAGYTRAQYEKEIQTAYDFVHPDDLERVRQAIVTANRTGEFMTLYYRIVQRGGGIRWLEGNFSMIRLPGYPVPVQMAVCNDITQQHLATQREQQASSQLQAILNNMSGGVAAVALEKDKVRYIFVNKEYYAILGYTQEQFDQEVPDGLMKLINPADFPAVKAGLDQLAEAATPLRIQFRVRRRDGREIWLHGSYSMCHIVGIDAPTRISMIVNVTEQREAAEHFSFLNKMAHEILAQPDPEKGLDVMLHNLLLFFGASRTYIFEIDPEKQTLNNTYEVCSEQQASRLAAMSQVQGQLTAPWLKALGAGESIYARDFDRWPYDSIDKAYLMAEKIESFMLVPLRRSGRLIGFMGADNPCRNHAHMNRLVALGDYAAVMLTRRDDEATLKRHIQFQAQIMKDIPGGYVMLNLQADRAQAVYINEEFCRLCGLTHQQAMTIYQTDAYSGLHPDDRQMVRQTLDQARQNKTGTIIIKPRFICGDGSFIRLQAYYRITVDAEGQQRLTGYFSGISREEQKEEQRQVLLDNLPQGAALLAYENETLSLLYLNKRYWQLVRREPAESWKENFLKAVHPDDLPLILHQLRAAVSKRQDISVNARILSGQGRYQAFHIAAAISAQGSGKYLIYATYTPVSNELDTLLSAMRGGVFKCADDSEGSFSYVNSSFIHKLGYTRTEFLSKFQNSFYQMVYKADRERVKADLHESPEAAAGRLEYRIETRCGQLRWFLNEWCRKKDAAGQDWLYVTVMDISGQRAAEARLRLLTDSLSGGVGSFEYAIGKLRTLYLNEGFYRYLGYNKHEDSKIRGADPLSLVYEADRPVVRQAFINLIKGRCSMATCRFRGYHKQGMSSWLSLSGSIAEIRDHTYIFNVLLVDITEQVNNEQQLRMSEEAYRLAAMHSDVTIARYILADRSLYMTAKANARYKLPALIKDVPYASVSSGLISPESQPNYIHFFESILQGKKEGSVQYQAKLGQAWRWIEAHFSTLFSDSGKPVSAIITFREITGQLEQEALYKRWLQSLRDRPVSSYTLYRCNISQDASAETIEGNLLETGFPSHDSLTLSARLETYALYHVYPPDQADFRNRVNREALLKRYEHGIHRLSLTYRENEPEHEARWIRLTAELIAYPGTSDIMAYFLFEDIDRQQRESLKMQRLAETDSLTGLLNRQAFTDKVDFHLQAARRESLQALLMLDVDNFKMINDLYGHVQGDEALRMIARLLQQQAGDGELVCRLGGDEFMLFLPDQNKLEDITLKATTISQGLHELTVVALQLSASIGIALSPGDGQSFSELYKKADKAMYEVKTHGKDTYTFYNGQT